MRVLVAIGCDTYDSLSCLGGAEADARAVYEHLVTNGWGEYDALNSVLLLSPTSNEVRRVLTSTLFDPPSIDEVTIFFAGHGAVKDDAYFLCLRDSIYERLSVSALPLAAIFGWIAEAKARQTNLVLDACQSGGVARDIGYLLSPGVIGNAGSPGVSILAASASDQEAMEVGGRGLCTLSLIKCLKGETKVQSTRPTLDLVEVGHVVAGEFKGATQQPACWGLNLLGRGQFAKNPHYGGGKPHIEDMLPPQADPRINSLVRQHAPTIWESYAASKDVFDPNSFSSAILPGVKEIAAINSVAAAIFLEGVETTFGESLSDSADLFAKTEMHATCAAIWLNVSSETDLDTQFHISLLQRVYQAGINAVRNTSDLITDYPYNLLGIQSGLPDLFFLPNRLLRLLGWIGALQHTAVAIGESYDPICDRLQRQILDLYASSIVSISDEQASFWTAYITSPSCNIDIAEQFLGLLFSSFLEAEGVVARPMLSGSDAFRFIRGRADGKVPTTLVARPTSILSTFLLSYRYIALDALADECLIDIDYLYLNFYVAESLRSFNDDVMQGGTNYTYQVGHHIFSVEDLVEEFQVVAADILRDPLSTDSVSGVAALYASLLWPNRVAWHMFMRPLGIAQD